MRYCTTRTRRWPWFRTTDHDGQPHRTVRQALVARHRALPQVRLDPPQGPSGPSFSTPCRATLSQ